MHFFSTISVKRLSESVFVVSQDMNSKADLLQEGYVWYKRVVRNTVRNGSGYNQMASRNGGEGFWLDGSGHNVKMWSPIFRVNLLYNTASHLFTYSLWQFYVNRSWKEAASISIQKREAMSLLLNLAMHGSYCNEYFANGVTYDVTFCFVDYFWPLSASSWIYRYHPKPPPETFKTNNVIL